MAPAQAARMRRVVLNLTVLAMCCILGRCHGSPTDPHATALPDGQWTGGGACLSVASSMCDLTVGCGHGQFAKPAIRSDGTFDVDGTYDVEVGPTLTDPPPPAHFSGSFTGSTLNLNVTPKAAGVQSYSMSSSGTGTCPRLCV